MSLQTISSINYDITKQFTYPKQAYDDFVTN
jgi:hypothetical protein